MTTAYLAAVSASFFAAGLAVGWKLTALHYRSRLSEATASEALYKAWWERDSGKMLIAQASLDLIHQQHVDAGRKAHEPWKALRRETTEKLMQCVAQRDAHKPLEDALAASSSAGSGSPSTPPLSFSCPGSAAGKTDESGEPHPKMPTGRGAVNSRRRPSGPRPGIRPAPSAGETARSIHPAETTMKGA